MQGSDCFDAQVGVGINANQIQSETCYFSNAITSNCTREHLFFKNSSSHN